MIGNKFNFVVGAAIFASTIYFLWIKIRKNTNFYKKLPNSNGSTEKNDKDINDSSKSQDFETLDNVAETALQNSYSVDAGISVIEEMSECHLKLDPICFQLDQIDNVVSHNSNIDKNEILIRELSSNLHCNENEDIFTDSNDSLNILCNKMKLISINSPLASNCLNKTVSEDTLTRHSDILDMDNKNEISEKFDSHNDEQIPLPSIRDQNNILETKGFDNPLNNSEVQLQENDLIVNGDFRENFHEETHEINFERTNDCISNIEKNITCNKDSYVNLNHKEYTNEDLQLLVMDNENLDCPDNIFEETKEISKDLDEENEIKHDLLIKDLEISNEAQKDEILECLNHDINTENVVEEFISKSSAVLDNSILDVDESLKSPESSIIDTNIESIPKDSNSIEMLESSNCTYDENQLIISNENEQFRDIAVSSDIEELNIESRNYSNYQSVDILTTDELSEQSSNSYMIDGSETNESDVTVINALDVASTLTLNHSDSNSNMSHVTDFSNDSSSNSLLEGGTLMEYIEDCLNGKKFDNDLIHSDDLESTGKHENWPNDENSMNNIKRDFYDQSTICSPHPSSESDHAHCVNNLTERVAILSAESILDSQYNVNSDSEMAPIMSFLTIDDANPELYVEKITYCGKELDIVYFEEAVLEAGGVQSDIKIVRTIPVGLGGRIIGKKGKTKNELMKKFGAKLLIYNHPFELGKQVLEITCNPSVKDDMEKWVNKTLEQITKNTIQTTVSNPEWLKPMIPLGRLVAAHIIDMPTIQHIKLRIYDPVAIKEFNVMQKAMNIDYNSANNNPLLPRPVAVGCVCVAMIRPDFFVRAQIVEIYDDYAWIYLLDVGKICQTYLFYLFKIREKYMRIPFQIIPARLPHALLKNKNFTSEIIHKRFLCDQSSLKPKMVRVFFPRMSTCCEPCVNVYIPMSTISETHSNDEFVDLLEVLVSMDVCSMVRETINSEMQVRINTNHFMAFLNEQDKKDKSISNVPVYFQPCNSKFYEDYVEIKQEDSTDN